MFAGQHYDISSGKDLPGHDPLPRSGVIDGLGILRASGGQGESVAVNSEFCKSWLTAHTW